LTKIVGRAATTLAALTLTLSLGVAPAVALAAGGLPAWACSPADMAAGAGANARGGIADSRGQIREKDTGQVATRLPAAAVGAAPAGFSVTVPVWFHVVTDGAVGYLSDNDIRAQIRVLNITFGGQEGGDDSGFAFELAGVTRTDNAKWFAMKGGGVENEMKKALKQGGDDTLNVYSTTAGAYLGWAYLPSITESKQAHLDGVVLDWASLPHVSDQYVNAYDEGETLTHEVGHWLNLEHTFFGGCTETNDFVADTPAMKTPTSGCPAGKDTCPAPGLDPIHNYMDYSFDDCYTEFTPGQSQRMQDSWLLYRAT
jgi:hypothetical protein